MIITPKDSFGFKSTYDGVIIGNNISICLLLVPSRAETSPQALYCQMNGARIDFYTLSFFNAFSNLNLGHNWGLSKIEMRWSWNQK